MPVADERAGRLSNDDGGCMDISNREQPLTVFLLRHGQTTHNVADRLRGQADLVLDETGLAQAEHLRREFADIPVQRVIASPLKRALETAGPLARTQGVTVQINKALNDRDYGPWTGWERATVVERFGSIDQAPDIEDREAFNERIIHAFTQIVTEAEDSCIVIIGHDASNRALLAALFPELPTEYDKIPQANGCWNQLDYNGQTWRLVALNQ